MGEGKGCFEKGLRGVERQERRSERRKREVAELGSIEENKVEK